MNARVAPTSALAGDLVSLTKPRLSTLVMITAAGGMWLAPGEISAAKVVIALLATAGTVGAANALNCYLERDSDRFMARTQGRPLPAGRMEPQVALGFGLSLAAVCLPALAVGVNLLTGALAALAFFSYVAIYTPLKSRSPVAMVVGALPGALPPLMGWTAVRNAIEPGGLVLFAILFFWQLPHFLAIALFRKDEYRKAGLTSVPLAWGDGMARAQAVAYAAVLLPASMMLFTLGVAGPLYAAVAFLLGLGMLGWTVVGAWRGLGARWARQLFGYSLVYLTVLFAVLVVDAGLRS